MITEFVTIFTLATLFDIVAISILLLILMIGIHIDRKGATDLKWWVLFILISYYVISFHDHITIQSTKEMITSGAFIFGILKYVIAGLLYSALEIYLFIHDASQRFSAKVVAAKKSYEKRNSSNLTSNSSYDFVKTFGFIESSYRADENIVSTNVNTSTLSKYIGSWTLFWPFYLIDLVIGRWFANIFNGIATVVSTMTKNRIQRIFESKAK